MKKWIQTFMGPQLLWRLTRWNALQVMAKTLSGLLSAKIYALWLGPAGMAQLGAFRNLLAEWEVGATLGLENSLIREWADPLHSNLFKKQLASTAAALMALMGGVLLLLSILFYPSLERIVFQGMSLPWWFWMGCWLLLPLYWAQQYVAMLLNGLGLSVQVFQSAFWGSLLNMALTLVLVWGLQVTGAMWSLLAFPAVMLVWYVYLFRKHLSGGWVEVKRIHWPALQPLIPLSFMGLLAAVVQPMLQWYIRGQVWQLSGASAAGYVEGLNRLSSFGWVFMSSLLAYYFLPLLTQQKAWSARKHLIRQYLLHLWPLYVLVLLAAYLTQSWWLSFLFSEAFTQMADGLGWQCLGDALRALSLLGGYFFFVEKKAIAFAWFECGSALLWAVLAHSLIKTVGWIGAPQAYALTYMIYTPAVWGYVWWKIRNAHIKVSLPMC